MNKINEIILGHNSFYGINHLDSEIGKKKLINQFDNDKKIIKLLQFANQNNLNNLMISTVEESQSLIEEINKDIKLKNDLNLFVLLPYINKYVRKTNELGIMGTLKEIILKQDIKKNLKHVKARNAFDGMLFKVNFWLVFHRANLNHFFYL